MYLVFQLSRCQSTERLPSSLGQCRKLDKLAIYLRETSENRFHFVEKHAFDPEAFWPELPEATNQSKVLTQASGANFDLVRGEKVKEDPGHQVPCRVKQ